MQTWLNGSLMIFDSRDAIRGDRRGHEHARVQDDERYEALCRSARAARSSSYASAMPSSLVSATPLAAWSAAMSALSSAKSRASISRNADARPLGHRARRVEQPLVHFDGDRVPGHVSKCASPTAPTAAQIGDAGACPTVPPAAARGPLLTGMTRSPCGADVVRAAPVQYGPQLRYGRDQDFCSTGEATGSARRDP